MLPRLVILSLLLAPALGPGCKPDGAPMAWTPPTLGDPAPRPTLSPLTSRPAQPGDLPQYRSVIALQIIRVELPTGTVNASEQLWNCLNEEPVAVNRTAEFGRNGLRMGLGEGAAWADLAAILQKLTGRALAPTRTFAWPGTVMDVVARREQPAQSIFLFFGDKTRAGSDYPPGDNVFAVSCSVDETNPQGVILTGVPQIRSSQAQAVPAPGEPRMGIVSPYSRTPFTPLTFRVTIPPKGFLLLGPGSAALNTSTLGNHFLIDQHDGLSFETVLILLPEVIRKAVQPSGPDDPGAGVGP